VILALGVTARPWTLRNPRNHEQDARESAPRCRPRNVSASSIEALGSAWNDYMRYDRLPRLAGWWWRWANGSTERVRAGTMGCDAMQEEVIRWRRRRRRGRGRRIRNLWTERHGPCWAGPEEKVGLYWAYLVGCALGPTSGRHRQLRAHHYIFWNAQFQNSTFSKC